MIKKLVESITINFTGFAGVEEHRKMGIIRLSRAMNFIKNEACKVARKNNFKFVTMSLGDFALYLEKYIDYINEGGAEQNPSANAGYTVAGPGGKGGPKDLEELKDEAAIFLEEAHISGDTMVDLDHSMEGVESGAMYVHDLMAYFVKSLGV